MDEVSQEQSDVLDRLLANMADAELNARMKALTDEKEALKAQILKSPTKRSKHGRTGGEASADVGQPEGVLCGVHGI